MRKRSEWLERLLHRGVRLDKLCALWLEDVRGRVKASSLTRYDTIISHHILPYFGGCAAQELTAAMVEQFEEEHLAGLSPKSVCDILSVLRNVLRFAQREGYLSGPAPELASPRLNRRETRVLNREEQRLLEHTLSEKTLDATGVLLCLYTGLRLGEVCGLRWGDIDLNHNVLTVRRTVQRLPQEGAEGKTALCIGTPKTACSHRCVPLPPFLAERLADYQQEPDCYLLTGQPDKPMQPRTYQYIFKRYLARAGVADANFHALRHTFATRCVESGFDPKSLSELLGHSTVNITLNRYVHASLDWKREQMNRLEALI